MAAIEQPIPSSQANAQSVYERQRLAECAPYQTNFTGSVNALFCVVSNQPATEQAQAALTATAKRGGFLPADMVWITTNDLEAAALMHLIESIDPLCVVVLDQKAAELLSRAYNQPIKLATCDFLLGRPCACFVDFNRMLEADDRKQQAWALMKEMLAYVDDV